VGRGVESVKSPTAPRANRGKTFELLNMAIVRLATCSACHPLTQCQTQHDQTTQDKRGQVRILDNLSLAPLIAFRQGQGDRRCGSSPIPFPGRSSPRDWKVAARDGGQHTRRGEPSRGRGHHSSLCLLKKGNNLLAPYGGKSFKKIVNGFPSFEIVKEGRNRHAGAGKNRGPAHDIRRTGNEWLAHGKSLRSGLRSIKAPPRQVHVFLFREHAGITVPVPLHGRSSGPVRGDTRLRSACRGGSRG
jgi:hypothetical protein